MCWGTRRCTGDDALCPTSQHGASTSSCMGHACSTHIAWHTSIQNGSITVMREATRLSIPPLPMHICVAAMSAAISSRRIGCKAVRSHGSHIAVARLRPWPRLLTIQSACSRVRASDVRSWRAGIGAGMLSAWLDAAQRQRAASRSPGIMCLTQSPLSAMGVQRCFLPRGTSAPYAGLACPQGRVQQRSPRIETATGNMDSACGRDVSRIAVTIRRAATTTTGVRHCYVDSVTRTNDTRRAARATT